MLESTTNEAIVVADSKRQRLMMSLIIIVTLLIGIGIGTVLSGGTFADKDDHRISIVSGTTIDPNGLSAAFSRVAEAVEPSVVHINTVEQATRDGFDLFRDFHGGGSRRGSGSGIIVDNAGYILTNKHVVDDAVQIKVKFYDGTELNGKVIGTDRETDLAVIKVDSKTPLPPAKMGDSDKMKVGDWVIAIGSPFGLEQTVTAGIISARERSTGESNFQQFLQTDAAINPGNSGGPLVNLAGEVIGINTQIATRTGVYNGIGFALPSKTAVDVYNQLVTTGRVSRGYIGVYPVRLTPQIARQNNIADGQGALINDLSDENGPAAKAGLRSGDIIIEFNGSKIKDERDLVNRVASSQVGSTVSVKYVREGKVYTTTIKLGDRAEINKEPDERLDRTPRFNDDEEPGGRRPQPGYKENKLGLELETLGPEKARRLNLGSLKGALITRVIPGSLADDNQLRPGEVIVSVNGQVINSEEEFGQIIGSLKPGDDVVLKVARYDARSDRNVIYRFVSFTLP